MDKSNSRSRKPLWLKSKIPSGENVSLVSKTLKEHNLHTVCEEARCPNRHECWKNKTATMMILGDICTRGCRFCSVKTGNPKGIVDLNEIDAALKLVQTMNLNFIVITSVDRDDLPDYGADHFACVIKAIKAQYPKVYIEVLIPDFNRDEKSMHLIGQSDPLVIAHNLETVKRLTPHVRDKRAGYEKSLMALQFYKDHYPHIATKSSLMLGLSEEKSEVIETMRDLREHHVDILTLGQYLQPSKKALEVAKYYEPSEFLELEKIAYDLGFSFVAAGPMVRSSYKAADYLSYLERKNVSK